MWPRFRFPRFELLAQKFVNNLELFLPWPIQSVANPVFA